LQESKEDQTMTVTSGLKCLESSKNPDHDGLLERMFLASSTWHSTMCKLTWKENITRSGNSYYRLLPSMRSTEEIEYSLLPTPTAQQYGTSQNGKRKDGTTFKQAGKPSLHTMARHNLWPTPTVQGNYNKKGLSKKSGDGLATAVNKMWPTPTTRDHKGGYVGGRIRNGKVSWDTLDVAVQHTDNQEKVSGSLNPTWVEWLMGFPIEWTELKD
jgi:hypothetical protein